MLFGNGLILVSTQEKLKSQGLIGREPGFNPPPTSAQRKRNQRRDQAQITEQTPVTKQQMEQRYPTQAQPKTEPIKLDSKIAQRKTIYADPFAARVLKDIAHEDVKKVRVVQDVIPGTSVRLGARRVTPEQYERYKIARATGREEEFYQAERIPKPLAPPPIAAVAKRPARFTEESKQEFKDVMASQIEARREVIKAQTRKEDITIPRLDVFARGQEKLISVGRGVWKKGLGEERYEKYIGSKEKYFQPEYVEQKLTKLEEPKTELGKRTMFKVGAGLETWKEVRREPLKIGLMVAGGGLIGGLTKAAAATKAVTLGQKATKVVGGSLLAIGTGAWAGTRVSEYIQAEKSFEKGQVTAKTTIEVLSFGIGAGTAQATTTRPIEKPTVKPQPRPKSGIPKGKTPKEFFIRRTQRGPERSKFEAVERKTGRAHEIGKGEIHKYRDIFGLKGKQAQYRISRPRFEPIKGKTSKEFIERSSTKLKPIEKPYSIVKGLEGDIIPRPRTPLTTRPSSDIIPRPRTPLTTRPTTPISLKPVTDIIPTPDKGLIIKPSQDLVTRQPTELVPRPRMEITERFPEPIKPRKPKKPSGTRLKFPRVGVPGFPFFPRVGGGGGIYSMRGIGGKGGLPKKYMPSLSAVTLGIYGERKSGILTGLEQRPILGKKPKKKKKKRRSLI